MTTKKTTTKSEKTDELLQEEKQNQLNFATESVTNKGFSSMNDYSHNIRLNKNQIKRLLQSPIQNYQKLQQISVLLSTLNGIYNRLINHFSSSLTFDHFLYPSMTNDKLQNEDKITKSYEDAALYLDKMNLKYNLPIFTKQMFLKGEVFVYKLEDTKGIVYQEIPNELCRLAQNIDGVYGYEINVSLLNDTNIIAFPLEFQRIYDSYSNQYSNNKNTKGNKSKKNSGEQQLLPNQNPNDLQWFQISDRGIAFPTITNTLHSHPPFSYLFTDIIDIDNAKDLKKEVNRLENTKMIHNKVPIDNSTGLPTMDINLTKQYNKAIKDNITEGIFSVTNPFETEVLNLNNSQQNASNLVEEAVDQMFTDSGVSDLLFANKKASSEALKMSIKTDMAILFNFILPMFTNYINYELKKINSVYRWKCKMLEITYFDRSEQIKQFVSTLPLGDSRLQYLATKGLTPLEALNTLKFEQIINIDNLLTPKMNSHVLSGSSTDVGGRPTETNPSDSTESWKDTL